MTEMTSAVNRKKSAAQISEKQFAYIPIRYSTVVEIRIMQDRYF